MKQAVAINATDIRTSLAANVNMVLDTGTHADPAATGWQWNGVAPAPPPKQKVAIAVLVPSTLTKVPLEAEQIPTTFSLFSTLIPSLEKTAEPGRYDYHVYVGIDGGDRLTQFTKEIAALSIPGVTVEPIVIPGSHNFNMAVNHIAQVAFDSGADFLCRVNDDSEFVSGGWTSRAVQSLASMSPRNVGVVGPQCKEGKQGIMTHDFVHKTHYDIFGYYYPPEFKNWCTDDWITNVYGGIAGGESRAKQLQDWQVVHHCDVNVQPELFSGGKHGPNLHHCSAPRYGIDHPGCALLDGLVANGKETLRQYLESPAPPPPNGPSSSLVGYASRLLDAFSLGAFGGYNWHW